MKRTVVLSLLLFLVSSVKADMPPSFQSLHDLFESIGKNYFDNGLSGDMQADAKVKNEFWRWSDSDFLFNFAAQSEIQRPVLGKKKFALLRPALHVPLAGDDLLQDKFQNKDFFFIEISTEGLKLLGSLHLYQSCVFDGIASATQIKCERVEDEFHEYREKFKWDGSELKKTESKRISKPR